MALLCPENWAIPISVYINRRKSRSVHCSWKAAWQFQDGNVYPNSIQSPWPCFSKVQTFLQISTLAICFRALVRFWSESSSSSPHAGFGLLFRLRLVCMDWIPSGRHTSSATTANALHLLRGTYGSNETNDCPPNMTNIQCKAPDWPESFWTTHGTVAGASSLTASISWSPMTPNYLAV